MKTNFFIVGMACMLFMMWGCKDTDPATELKVDTEVLEMTSDGGVVTISVTCNKVSKATIEYDNPAESGWIFMLPTVLLNGNGILELRVNAYSNIWNDRTATITISSGDVSKSVAVTQLSKPALNISPPVISTTLEANLFTIDVESKANWDATVNSEAASWCTLTDVSGSGIGNFKVNVTAMTSTDVIIRKAFITVTTADGLTDVLTLQQGIGVEINGIIWAHYNVGEPGQFSNEPDDPGLLYQYNSKIGYPIEGGVPEGYETGYVDNGANTWTAEQNPCPAGWRIPTADEIDALVGSNNNNFAWLLPEASGFSKAGIVIGISLEEAAQATKSNMRGGIFIPISGYRHVETGSLTSSGNVVIQSITRPGQNWDRIMYGFWNYGMYKYGGGPDGSNRSALSIRCVADIDDI